MKRIPTFFLALLFLTFCNVVAGGGSRAATSSSTAGSPSSSPSRDADGGPLQIFSRTILDARRHLAAAAVARTTSIFAMYPVDSFKTRIQMEQANPFRLKGIFNGVAGSLLGQVPYGVLTFGSYEMYKQTLLDRFPRTKPIFLYAAAAVAGDLTGSGWLCPSEVIKQKVQAGMFASTGEAVRSVWKAKGLVGFYEGYWGGVTRDVPFRVAQLTTYEVTKNLYLRLKGARLTAQQQNIKKKGSSSTARQQQPLQLTPVEAAMCGAVSGSFSAAVTAPLDRFKTLLMTDSQAYGGTVAKCAAKIWREEGLRGMVTGVVPRVVYIAPSVVIFFVAYEMTQQRLQHWQVKKT